MKDIWVVNSTNGILSQWGWFETYEDCLRHCTHLAEGISRGNVKFYPLKLNKNE
jgi:hypothetical protein